MTGLVGGEADGGRNKKLAPRSGEARAREGIRDEDRIAAALRHPVVRQPTDKLAATQTSN